MKLSMSHRALVNGTLSRTRKELLKLNLLKLKLDNLPLPPIYISDLVLSSPRKLKLVNKV